MPRYIAKVLLVVDADGDGDACDAVFHALQENLVEKGMLVDWAYALNDGSRVSVPRELPSHLQGINEFEGISLDLAFRDARRSSMHGDK